MEREFEFLTFDCYGTLIDWEQGITGAFAEIAHAIGHTLDRQQVPDLFAQIEPEVQAEPYRRYADVLEVVAARIADRLGFEIPAERKKFLSETLPSWPPFHETGAALESLYRAGYRLGILSNVDDDLLRGSLDHLPVTFELLVTAEQVGSYKPAKGHFLEARRRILGTSWLHVAQSFFHDVQPSVALGIPVVWINRKHEEAPLEAGYRDQFPDLSRLSDRLLRAGGLG